MGISIIAVSYTHLDVYKRQVGNNNIGDYSSIGLMSNTNYIFNGNKVGGYSPSSFSNPDLGWEKTQTTDIGIDLGFVKNRINLSLDYYIANTKDLLLNVPIPQICLLYTSRCV